MYAERDDAHVEEEEFRTEEELEDYGPRSIFAAGWFRAVLLLTVLAIVVVVALPSLLDWFEPASSPVKEPARPAQLAPSSGAPAPEQSRVRATSAPATSGESAVAAQASSLTGSAPAATRASVPLRGAKASGAVQVTERGAAIPTKPDGLQSGDHGGHWVQIGLFKDQHNAERLAKKVRGQGFSVEVMSVTRSGSVGTGGISGGTYHLVRVGVFRDQRGAVAARDDLRDRGYAAFVAEAATK